MRGAGHVARVGENINFSLQYLKEGDHAEEVGVNTIA